MAAKQDYFRDAPSLKAFASKQPAERLRKVLSNDATWMEVYLTLAQHGLTLNKAEKGGYTVGVENSENPREGLRCLLVRVLWKGASSCNCLMPSGSKGRAKASDRRAVAQMRGWRYQDQRNLLEIDRSSIERAGELAPNDTAVLESTT